MIELTRQQRRVYDYIRAYLDTEHMPPTRAEIAAALGFRTANTAQAHIKALVRKGYLELLPGRSRNVRPIGDTDGHLHKLSGIPLIGRVAAGSPVLAVEHIETRYPCAALFEPNADFLLRVRGDSMRDAGIRDGDLLGVHKTATARDGEIVVARIDDEVTVKTLTTANGRIRLLPANPDFAPINVDPARQEFTIEGLAVGTIRRFSLDQRPPAAVHRQEGFSNP